MKEIDNKETEKNDNLKIESYDDANAPWNKEWDDKGIQDWNKDIIQEFRQNGGKVGGAYEGGDLLLLTTVGAKSGKKHIVPLSYLFRDETMFLSSFIEGKYPSWYYNIQAHPVVTVEMGTETYQATAKALTGAEYTELWQWIEQNMPYLVEYRQKVGRALPLVTLQLHK